MPESTNVSYQAMYEFAVDLAKSAGQLVAQQRAELTIEFKGENAAELVTQADIAADKLITNSIKKQFPDHQILSEELSPTSEADAEHLWVIDPIDGTVNYAHGHSQVAISIAYFHKGKVKVGVVYNPFTAELFSAQKDQGAVLNNQQIRCSDKQEMKRALIATGFPYIKDNLDILMLRLQTVLEHCADIRRIGSAALDICWVACGRLDAYYESVQAWDFAAAQLIATEAGATFGHIHPVDENPQLDGSNIIVATPGIYSPLKSLLIEAERNH